MHVTKAPTPPTIAKNAPTRIVYKSRGSLDGGTTGTFGGFIPILCVGVYHDIYRDLYGCT